MTIRTPVPRKTPLLRTVVRNDGVMTGVFFMLIGCVALWIAMDYPAGSARRMLEGYFPRLISSLLILVGAAIAASGLAPAAREDDPARAGWRPILFVPLAILCFGSCIESLGLIPAIFMTVTTLAFAEPRRRWLETLALGAVLNVIACVLFIWILGLPLLLFPHF